jgi:hypothetical protein
MSLTMGPFIVHLTLRKWLWNSHVGKLEKNTMRMSVHKILEQMKKIDPKNQMKTITPEK